MTGVYCHDCRYGQCLGKTRNRHDQKREDQHSLEKWMYWRNSPGRQEITGQASMESYHQNTYHTISLSHASQNGHDCHVRTEHLDYHYSHTHHEIKLSLAVKGTVEKSRKELWKSCNVGTWWAIDPNCHEVEEVGCFNSGDPVYKGQSGENSVFRATCLLLIQHLAHTCCSHFHWPRIVP